MIDLSLINLDLQKFIDFINLKKSWDIKYDIIDNLQIRNQLRCMGRIWDSKDWNINKQCKNKVFDNDLCISCFKKSTIKRIGRVDEYPDYNFVTKWYIDGLKKINSDRNIENEIDLEIFEKFKKIKKHNIVKNNICNIKYMQQEQKKNIKFKISSNNLKKQYEKFNIETNEIKDNNNWFDNPNLDKIKIFDPIDNSSSIFVLYTDDNNNYLLNKNKVIIGEFYDWESKEIDDIHKNSFNKILDPDTNIPIVEYKIFEKTSIYHNISPGIYRSHRFDKNIGEFIITNSLELI